MSNRITNPYTSNTVATTANAALLSQVIQPAPFKPTLFWLGGVSMALTWGPLIWAYFIAGYFPESVRDLTHQVLLGINNYYRWIVPTLALIGLAGLTFSAVSLPRVRKLRIYRPFLIGAGLLVVVPILIMALLVDLQPPGSPLAMIISMFGSILGVLAVLGVAVGGLGVLLHYFGEN